MRSTIYIEWNRRKSLHVDEDVIAEVTFVRSHACGRGDDEESLEEQLRLVYVVRGRSLDIDREKTCRGITKV